MTPPPHAPLDIVTVLITLFSAILAPELANVLGPYVVIVLSALGGAAWSSTYGEASTRRSTALHIVLMVGLALIATVPLAELAVARRRARALHLDALHRPLASAAELRRWFGRGAGRSS